jgi:hypothetical protein
VPRNFVFVWQGASHRIDATSSFPPQHELSCSHSWIYGRHNMDVLYSRRLCVALTATALLVVSQPASWSVTTPLPPCVAHSAVFPRIDSPTATLPIHRPSSMAVDACGHLKLRLLDPRPRGSPVRTGYSLAYHASLMDVAWGTENIQQ